MSVVIIGAEGQLGTDLCRLYGEGELHRLNHADFDVADGERVREVLVEELRPALVINTAAAHNVPACEAKPDWAFSVNATGALNLAAACDAVKARLVHISTDYVFGSGGRRPYVEEDMPGPVNVYGASKLAGEHLIASRCRDYVIVRTSALYGAAPCRAKEGKNFVDLMLHLAATRDQVKVVTDEIVSPTYAGALARQIKKLAEWGKPGLYHATSGGECSWFDYARTIFDETGTEVRLVEGVSSDFPSSVKRPDYSVLENRRLHNQGIDDMPHWRDGLKEYLAEVGLGKA